MNTFFLTKLIIDLLAIVIIVGLMHYKLYKKSEYIFTYVIFNIIIFILSYVMQSANMTMGAAFGLFAVFSILRYRTEDIGPRDMTYLFIVIALGLLNAIHKQESWNDMFYLIGYNAVLVAATFLLETSAIMRKENVQSIQYENIENIKPENLDKLLADLRSRTGLNVHRVEIGKIDFLRDTANVKIYYYNS
jgi:thiol:disulfide interchange protein